MNDPASTPQDPRPHRSREYDDPHYHDEDDDVQRDDLRRKPGPGTDRRQAARKLPSPRWRFEE